MHCDQNSDTLYHILVLGQSLSMGYATGEALPAIALEDAYMFRRVRTQDLGYVFGITKDEYAADPDAWEDAFYRELLPLQETGGDGDAAHAWESASPNEYETPCSGIVLGLDNAYRATGAKGKPYPTLISAPGIGGTPISAYAPGTSIYERAQKDIENGKRLAEQQGLSYAVLAIVWIQGENNYDTPTEEYATQLLTRKQEYTDMIRAVTGQSGEIPFVTYQTMAQKTYYPIASQFPALGQFAVAAGNHGVTLSAPCYQFSMYADHVHLTNTATRDMGILLGQALYAALHGEEALFSPASVAVEGGNAVLTFDAAITLDASGVAASHDAAQIAENHGFFCYRADGECLAVTALLSADGKTLTLTAEDDIALMAYGFDPLAKKSASYTYGGTVCRAATLQGTTGVLREYMPVQLLYGEIPEKSHPSLPDTIAGRSEIIVSETSPQGAGARDIDLMRDGVIPSAGESHSLVQYDTYTNRSDDHEEYYGYCFDRTYRVMQVVYTDGAHFGNGGWFKEGTLHIEIYVDGQWHDAEATVSPAYPTGDSMELFGSNYRTYTFILQHATACDGVRIVGLAGGSAHFTSISELEVVGEPHF